MAAVMKTSGLADLLTGAVALGVAELTAAVTGPNGAPVVAVGETAINLTLVPVKEFAIAHFGSHDKEALVTGIVASSRPAVRLPAPAVAVAAVPAGADFRIPGLTPFVTSNASFYRVDTDLVLPQVSPESWTLQIDGMVDTELEITFAELLKMPLTETDITLVCVSNEVGGTGTPSW